MRKIFYVHESKLLEMNRYCSEWFCLETCLQEEIGDKFRPIRAHIEFSLVSRADSNGVSPILDHDSMKFDHYVSCFSMNS